MPEKLKPLIPVPKVLVPAVAGAVIIAARWVATGEFDREELGGVVLIAGFALIGWSTPEVR